MKQQVYEEALKTILKEIKEGREREAAGGFEQTMYARAYARSGVLFAVEAVARDALGLSK